MGVQYILELVNKAVLNIDMLEEELCAEFHSNDLFSRDNPDDKPKDAEFRKLAEKWIPILWLMRADLNDYKIALRNIAYKFSTEDNVKDTEAKSETQ